MSTKQKSKTPFGATARTAEQTQRVLELRRSNAAQGHDSRPHRGRTRQSAKRAAMREWA